jgi:hypothetical protein
MMPCDAGLPIPYFNTPLPLLVGAGLVWLVGVIVAVALVVVITKRKR